VSFQGLTGRGVRVAIIDSGVNPSHPHVAGVAGGVAISPAGQTASYLDRLGHGTAVAGAIREKAPRAELFAVKIFDRSLTAALDTLLHAMEWSIDRGMHILNLSLGAIRQQHRDRFERILARAADARVAVVSARESAGRALLPGCLPGSISVALDWDCPRDCYYCSQESPPVFFASGFPRPIPGVPQERNLNGISFAVANITGFAALAREACGGCTPAELRRMLAENARLRVSS
jgi:subtilisin family serine protease